MWKLFCFVIIVSSCTSNDLKSRYNWSALLHQTNNKLIYSRINDSLFVAEDFYLSSDDFRGYYVFNTEGLLRSYGFYLNDSNYIYGQNYDTSGMLVSFEGTPVVEYNIIKNTKDTMCFEVTVSTLQKEIRKFEIETNNGDTFLIDYFKNSPLYSNCQTACISIFHPKVDSLIITSHLSVYYPFLDSLHVFKNITRMDKPTK